MTAIAAFSSPVGSVPLLSRRGQTCSWTGRPLSPGAEHTPAGRAVLANVRMSDSSDEHVPLLLRTVAGEPVPRAPVWLLRQAGRYMGSFRAYSDRLPFRARSEDAKIARELSLQPWRAFSTDAIILFSDILTPLPALGIDFDIVSGRGPVLPDPVRTLRRAQDVAEHAARFAPANRLPFVAEALGNLRGDVRGTDTALLGFVGAPFTLAAYSVEGAGAKHLVHTKRMIGGDDGAFRTLMDAVTAMIVDYAVYQLDSGAHAVQLFESWAHHLAPGMYAAAALPWVRLAGEGIKAKRPGAKVFFFANGGAGKLELIKKELAHCVDVFHVDWTVDMTDARARLGSDVCLQGNVDPGVLLTGTEDAIRREVRRCIATARPGRHILNLGHGVVKETPEEAVRIFCDAARENTFEVVDSLTEEDLAPLQISDPVRNLV